MKRAKTKRRAHLRVVEEPKQTLNHSLLGIASRTMDTRRRRFILALDAMLPLLKPDDMDDIEKILERVSGREHFKLLLQNNYPTVS